ncbi:MAG: BC1881 family protein [Acidobacterium ailaaui]|nr:BC1881 family protein [Pseudacidobacterium ailaaui]
MEEVADGRSVGDVEALNVNSNSLADYSTAELTNELTKREGVDEYFVDPHEGKAFISVYNGEKSEQITVDGPARILINRD